MSLTAFLLARFAEVEEVARSVPEVEAKNAAAIFTSLAEPTGTVEMSPARVLAEVAARRQLVEMHSPERWPLSGRLDPFTGRETPEELVCAECSGEDDPYIDQRAWPCETIKVVASVYADHPDFREEWRA